MNPGPVEEAGQTARSFIDVMKQQPALLGSILTNIALILFIFYALTASSEARNKLTTQVLDNAMAIHKLLSERSVACPQ